MDAEEHEHPSPGSGSWEKWIAIGLVLTTAVLAGLFTWGEGLIHQDPPVRPRAEDVIAAAPDPMEPPALAVLESFFEAPDVTSKAAFVRDSGRVLPMMRDYHETRGHPFPTLGRVSPGQTASFGGTRMVLFEVEPFSGPRYPVAVAWDGHRLAVDWESLVAYGTMDWSEFVESEPSSTETLRVFIRSAPESLKPPGMPDGTASFRIEHRDDPQPLIACADAETAVVLQPLVENKRAPVTLEITWKPIGPGGSKVPQILRLATPGWSR